MLIYLDSNIVIYWVEQPGGWGAKAAVRISSMRANRDGMAVSDLTRLECRIGPLRKGDATTLAHFDALLPSSDIRVLALSSSVCDRASEIRARYRYSLPDAIHLAAAVEGGCDVFLSNDTRLAGFPDLTVEIL